MEDKGERKAREEEEEYNEVWWSSRQHLKQPRVHAVIQFVSCSQTPSCLHICAVQETPHSKSGGEEAVWLREAMLPSHYDFT